MLNRLLIEKKLQEVVTKEDLWLEETTNDLLLKWRSIESFTHAYFSSIYTKTTTSWTGQLNNYQPINQSSQPYTIYAIDGSQIYPDRHHGVNLSLINIGHAGFIYKAITSQADLHSIPYIKTQQELPCDLQESFSNQSFIDALRSIYEFEHALNIAHQKPNLIMFDGSLIFWHLGTPENPAPNAKYFFNSYIEPLVELTKKNIAYCSFISSPKSRDLIELLTTASSDQNKNTAGYSDAQLLASILPENHHTPIFKSAAPITRLYPTHLQPYFVYINIENTIGRIEIPAWIGGDQEKTQTIITYITDQMKKGRGYPLVLAEAHEQAVIKEYDRQFIIEYLEKKKTKKSSKKQIHKQRPII